MVFLILWAFCQYLTWMIFHFDDLMILGMVSSILSILFASCQYLIAWLVLEVVLVFGKSVSDSLTTTGGFCQFLDGYCWLLLDGVGGEVGLGSRAKLLQSSLGASPVPTYIHTPLALHDRHICQKQTVYISNTYAALFLHPFQIIWCWKTSLKCCYCPHYHYHLPLWNFCAINSTGTESGTTQYQHIWKIAWFLTGVGFQFVLPLWPVASQKCEWKYLFDTWYLSPKKLRNFMQNKHKC